MSVTTNADGDKITISISGRFDFSCHKEFREAYSAYDGEKSNFTVDLSSADYIDSSALGMLLLLREYAGSEQSKVTIIGAANEVKEILVVSNFDRLFNLD